MSNSPKLLAVHTAFKDIPKEQRELFAEIEKLLNGKPAGVIMDVLINTLAQVSVSFGFSDQVGAALSQAIKVQKEFMS
jgi:hypothetical protein